MIHPDHVTLEAAGAPPPGLTADCAPALQRVLDYLGIVTEAKLQLWERDYTLNTRALLVLSPLLAVPLYFSLIGRGRGLSRLLVPSTVNTLGAFSITFTDNRSQYLLRDFSVIAQGATDTPQSSGTAISMRFVNGGEPGIVLPPKKQHGGVVERVHVGPDYSTGSYASYFTTGVDLSGTPRPVVSDLTVCGCDGSVADSTDVGSPRYAAQTHLKIDECYSPRVLNSNFWHATMAVSYVCQAMNVQGFVFDGNHIEGVRTGLFVRHNQECPEGKVTDTGMQFRDIGFDIGNVLNWSFTGNHHRLEGSNATVYDMRFLAANIVTVAGSVFGSSVEVGVSPPTRVNIYIDANTSVNGVAHGMNFLIDTNVFGDLSANFATSAIQTTSQAQHIQIGASNAFNGQFTGNPVEDDTGTGQVVTRAGFPSTSPTSLAAVNPNGGPANVGLPTLGSAGATWPQSYSLGHYLPGNGPPLTAPGSGWVIFTDGNNNLAAQYLGHTPIVVVYHP